MCFSEIWGNLEKISFCRHRVVELEMLWGLIRDPNQVLSLTDVLAIGHIWKDALHCSRLETSNLHILAGHPQPAVQQVRSGPLHGADLGLSPCVPWIIPHCPPTHYPDCLSWVPVSRVVGRAVSWQGWGRASGSVCVCVCAFCAFCECLLKTSEAPSRFQRGLTEGWDN